METHQTIFSSLKQLQTNLTTFISWYQGTVDLHVSVYPLWDAKDVLGHITFWHESFARNIRDLALGRQPSPLKGKLSEVNHRSVASTKRARVPELIHRLLTAQATVETHIFDEEIDLIPYKKGSRSYSRQEHLDVVAAHIARHLKDLHKAHKRYGKTQESGSAASAER